MADQQSAGGASDQVGDQTDNTAPEVTGDTVSKAEFTKVLGELHKWKKSAKDNQSALEQLKTDKLKEKEDYKSLWETTKNELDSSKTKETELKSFLVQTNKYSAVQSAALKAGLRKEAEEDLQLLPLDDLEVEFTSSGRVLVNGADGFVNSLKKKRPHWFSDQSVAKFNSGGGKPGAGAEDEPEITPELLAKLEKEDRGKWKVAAQKYLLAQTSGKQRL